MSSPATAIDVADSLQDFSCDPPVHPVPSAVLANLIWMFHMGIVMPVAYADSGLGPAGKLDIMWGPTKHALEHKSNRRGCWACRVRESYLDAARTLAT